MVNKNKGSRFGRALSALSLLIILLVVHPIPALAADFIKLSLGEIFEPVEFSYPALDTDGSHVFFRQGFSGFLRELNSNQLTEVDELGGANWTYYGLSGNGQFVVYALYGVVYVSDYKNRQLTIVSLREDGGLPRHDCYFPSISADGNLVAFSGCGQDFTFGRRVLNGVFVKNLTTGELHVVNKTVDDKIVVAERQARISPNGRYVAFISRDPILGGNPDSEAYDVFRKDLQTGEIELVSTGGTVNDGVGTAWSVDLSYDGRFVTFETQVPYFIEDTNGDNDIYVKDMQTGKLYWASTSASGVGGPDRALGISIDNSGRFVTFNSANGYVENVVDGRQVYVKDIFTGEIDSIAKLDNPDLPFTGESKSSEISGDGRYLGISTGNGVFRVSNPVYSPDTDGDGLLDKDEVRLGTNINLADTDSDGLSDFEEVNFNGDFVFYTEGVDPDPINADTDGDGQRDGVDPAPLDATVFDPDYDDEIPFLPLWALVVLSMVLASAMRIRFKK